MRKFGDVMLELEEIIDELIDDHEVQWGDVFYLVYGHLKIHRPDAQEQYEEGGSPEFYYGPRREDD